MWDGKIRIRGYRPGSATLHRKDRLPVISSIIDWLNLPNQRINFLLHFWFPRWYRYGNSHAQGFSLSTVPYFCGNAFKCRLPFPIHLDCTCTAFLTVSILVCSGGAAEPREAAVTWPAAGYSVRPGGRLAGQQDGPGHVLHQLQLRQLDFMCSMAICICYICFCTGTLSRGQTTSYRYRCSGFRIRIDLMRIRIHFF